MAIIQTQYGTEAQAITCTLASLGGSASRESTVVDNNSNKFLDVLVTVRIRTNATTPTTDKKVFIYAYGTVDAATPVYPDTVTGTDAAITLNNPTQLKLIGVIEAVAASTTYTSEPMSVAQAFGGIMPQKWGIVVQNAIGASAFDATESNFKKIYQGIKVETQ